MRGFILAVFVLCLFSHFADARESCVTEKCHSNMGKERYVHGPVAVGDCLMCHSKAGQHKFAPIKGDERLCYKCHPDRMDLTREAYKQVKGDCTNCHNLHQSAYKYQLKKENNVINFNHDSRRNI